MPAWKHGAENKRFADNDLARRWPLRWTASVQRRQMRTCRQVRLAGMTDSTYKGRSADEMTEPELKAVARSLSRVLPGGGSKASAASKRIYQRAQGTVFPQLFAALDGSTVGGAAVCTGGAMEQSLNHFQELM